MGCISYIKSFTTYIQGKLWTGLVKGVIDTCQLVHSMSIVAKSYFPFEGHLHSLCVVCIGWNQDLGFHMLLSTEIHSVRTSFMESIGHLQYREYPTQVISLKTRNGSKFIIT